MALTIDGSDPTGDLGDLLDAKLPIAGGKMLQIVRATDATSRTTTSTTFVDASISVTITPQKSDSAIILIASAGVSSSRAGDTGNYGYLRISDSSNNAISGAQEVALGLANITGTGDRVSFFYVSLFAYATPATTSAVTYKLRFRSEDASTTIQLRNGANTGQLYAIEVSA
jgi:hypothetical protein